MKYSLWKSKLRLKSEIDLPHILIKTKKKLSFIFCLKIQARSVSNKVMNDMWRIHYDTYFLWGDVFIMTDSPWCDYLSWHRFLIMWCISIFITTKIVDGVTYSLRRKFLIVWRTNTSIRTNFSWCNAFIRIHVSHGVTYPLLYRFIMVWRIHYDTHSSWCDVFITTQIRHGMT